jgi:RNA 2',3'-cyclic 3'-phosphodiesterase
MRLFVALNLPKKERDRISRSARPLREAGFPVRWVDSEQYHVTLKFLGDVHPDRVERVQGALEHAAAATPAFDVELGGFGAFPTLRRPRVLWLGADPSPALRCLKQDIEWALAECGFAREMRAFHPHITIGRSTTEGGGGIFRGLDELVSGLEHRGRFTVGSVDLMSSQLTREGPRYSIVSSSQLDRSR